MVHWTVTMIIWQYNEESASHLSKYFRAKSLFLWTAVTCQFCLNLNQIALANKRPRPDNKRSEPLPLSSKTWYADTSVTPADAKVTKGRAMHAGVSANYSPESRYKWTLLMRQCNMLLFCLQTSSLKANDNRAESTTLIARSLLIEFLLYNWVIILQIEIATVFSHNSGSELSSVHLFVCKQMLAILEMTSLQEIWRCV